MTTKLPPPERREKPGHYSADELEALLIDDAMFNRPLGGPGGRGMQWAIVAIDRIAKQRRQSVDDAFVALVQRVQAETGDDRLVLG